MYFGDTQPLLLRLHIQIDGKPLQTAWEDFVQQIFNDLDTNKDGVLSKEEAERVPSGQLIFSGNLFNNLTAAPFNDLDENRDGKVTREELANYYRRTGGQPFQFSAIGQNPDPRLQQQIRVLGGAQQPTAGALNDALFKHLDLNKDGKLSRAELAEAASTLLQLDADDDEMIIPKELVPNLRNPAAGARVVLARQQMAAPPTNDRSPFLLVTPGTALALVKELQAKYGKGKLGDIKLSQKDLGLDAASFARLDTNKDGVLDAKELEQFPYRPADLELLVRLGRITPRQRRIDLAAPDGSPTPFAALLRKTDSMAALLDLGSVRLDFRANPTPPAIQVVNQGLRQFFGNQFKSADQGNKGYLVMQDVQQNNFFRNAFKMMDLNGDGKVTEMEMISFLDKMQQYQDKARASSASLAVADQGRGLFELLDTSKDGRLSVREMRNAVKLLDQLDHDRDGMLSRTEIPRSFQLALAVGPINNNNQLRGAVVFRAGPGMNTPSPAQRAGPVWFFKMDRNRDGDVSRREFLGTDEEFRRIDTDGDGLISLEEALKADRQFRKEKEQKR
jgi:Ca2+-binding EF-hand superfamily protein